MKNQLMKVLLPKILLPIVLMAASLQAQAVGTAAAPNVVNLGSIGSALSVNYGNSFTAPTSQKFYDDFVFNLLPTSSLSSVTASINLGSFLGINNISARLYQGTGPFNSSTTPLMQAWSTPFNAGSGLTGSTTVISLPSVSANVYTLEIRGDVVGLVGGSYAGVLNVTPLSLVPEPNQLPMLLIGAIGILFFVRRRT